MKSKSAFVTKEHILTVLAENARSDAKRVTHLLQERFKLTPKPNTLRKNLLRCSRQGLIKRKKEAHWSTGRRRYVYTLTEKGRGRLQFWTTQPDAVGDAAGLSDAACAASVETLLQELERDARAQGREEAFSLVMLSEMLSPTPTTQGFTQREHLLLLLLEQRTGERDFALWMWQNPSHQPRPVEQPRPQWKPPPPLQRTPRGKPPTPDVTLFELGLKLGASLERQKLLLAAAAKKQQTVAKRRSEDKQLVDRYLTTRFFDWLLARPKTPLSASGSAPSTRATATTDAAVDLERWWQQLPQQYKA